MKITAVIKDSFQEYRGQHSLVLFSHGCNMRCSYCYNLDKIMDSKNIIGDAQKIVDEYITPIHDAVVFLGGEPTIWEDDLIDAASNVKKRGLKVKIYTNALRPDVIKRLNYLNLVDAYSVDLKTVNNDFSKVIGIDMKLETYLKLFEETIQDIINYKKEVEVRTTVYSNLYIFDVEKYMINNHPTINHIITQDFRKNLCKEVQWDI